MPEPPQVIALPGTLCSPAIFADVAARMTTTDFEVVATPWLTQGNSWELSTVAYRLLGELNSPGDRPVVLAGHSTGGVIAILAALAAPHQIAGLLLSNTGANMYGHGDVQSVITQLDQEWGPTARTRVLDRCFSNPPHARLQQHLDDFAATVSKEAVLQALRSQYAIDLTPRLGQLQLPVCLAHGQRDRVRPVAHARFMAERIPNAELRLLDAGHTPMAEDPRGYAAALDQLLRRCDHSA